MNAVQLSPSGFAQTVSHVLARICSGLAKLAHEDDDSLEADDLRRLADRHASQPSFAADLLAVAEHVDARQRR